jgi:hypothetical protein
MVRDLIACGTQPETVMSRSITPQKSEMIPGDQCMATEVQLGLNGPAEFRQVMLVDDFAGSGYTLPHPSQWRLGW